MSHCDLLALILNENHDKIHPISNRNQWSISIISTRYRYTFRNQHFAWHCSTPSEEKPPQGDSESTYTLIIVYKKWLTFVNQSHFLAFQLWYFLFWTSHFLFLRMSTLYFMVISHSVQEMAIFSTNYSTNFLRNALFGGYFFYTISYF